MVNKKLHIAIIASWYPTEDFPFYGIFVEEQARILADKGHKVVVFYPYLNGNFKSFIGGKLGYLKNVVRNGIPVRIIPQNVWMPGQEFFFRKRLIRSLERDFKEYVSAHGLPDLLHSHSALMGGVAALRLKEKFSIPLIHTEHTSGFLFKSEQYSTADIEAVKKLYKQSNEFLFVSQYFKSQFENKYLLSGNQSDVLYNVVADEFFDKVHPLPETKFRVLSIGGLIPVKNHILLLKAWKQVNNQYKDVELCIAGNGILEEELKKFCVNNQMSETVIWMNSINKKELIHEIDAANVVVSTSKLETFGLVIAEAIARGRPVVATKSGGPEEIIGEYAGILVDFDERQLADAIISIYLKNKRYEPLALSENCKKKFGSDAFYDKIIKKYSLHLA